MADTIVTARLPLSLQACRPSVRGATAHVPSTYTLTLTIHPRPSSKTRILFSVQAFLSRRNNAYTYHRKRSAELHGAVPERPEGISLSLVSTVDTPFLVVTELPADVTLDEIAVAFR